MDLRELLLTFNLGELTLEQSRQYVYENARLTDQEIEISADGGAEARFLKKLSTPGQYQYREGWKGAMRRANNPSLPILSDSFVGWYYNRRGFVERCLRMSILPRTMICEK